MKRMQYAMGVVCALPLAVIILAASCSSEPDGAAPTKSSGKRVAPKEAGSPEASAADVVTPAADLDAAGLLDLQKEVKTISQALDVILTAYDIDEREGNLGKTYGNTPPIQAYSNDLIQEIKQSRSRLKALYQSKGVTPKSSSLSSRLNFQAQAAQQNLTGIFRNMFNTNYAARRVQSAKDFLSAIEEHLSPVMDTDEDFKSELATIHEEVSKRQDRASALQQGVSSGTADGMFPEMDTPAAPQAPKPKATSSDAGSPAAP